MRFANVRDVSRYLIDLVQGKAGLTMSPRIDAFAVAALPSAGANDGRLVLCTNGASGSACLAFSNSASWLRADVNSTVVNAGA
jgi:hypothetical protein